MPAATLIPQSAPPAQTPPIGGKEQGGGGKGSYAGVALFLVVAIAGAGYLAVRQRGAPAPVAAVRTAVAKQGTFQRTLRISGMTAAANTAYLTAPILSGNRSRGSSSNDFRLTLKSLIAPGTQVKPGDVVAEFDRQYIELRLDDLAASVRSRELTLKTVRAGLNQRRKAYDQRIVAAEGAVGKARLDLKTIPVRSAIVAERYRLNLEEAEARLEQLRAEVKLFDVSERASMRRQELELAEEQLDLRRGQRGSERMVVKSPIAGVFIPQRVRRGGEYKDIQAGDDLPSGTVIGEVHDTSRLTVEAYANQADEQMLRRGLAATLHVEAFPGMTAPARVARIGSLAQAGGARRDYVRTIPVRLDVVGRPEIMPNFTVAVDVVVEEIGGAVMVPREAVRETGAGASVWVKAGAGWRERAVRVAASNHVEVALAEGVTQGEVVALEKPGRSENEPSAGKNSE